MIKTSLAQWLERLESLHPKEMDLGLDRVSVVAQRLGLLPHPTPVITVSGTNGKGSTSAVLEALLVETGSVVGVCSSPHFTRFNERIRISGVEVEDQLIVQAFEHIEAARENTSLTYFEFATLAALWVFREQGVEITVLEVGLGGRLDAVNIVDATVSVVTSVELDHQQWLGDTRELIAIEKGGIFRSDQIAVIAEPSPPASLVDLAQDIGVRALYYGRDFYCEETATAWQPTLSNADGSLRHMAALPAGPLLPVNICAALQALLSLGETFSDEQVYRAVTGIQLRGRREYQEIAGLGYFLDVAHNPAAVDKLLEYIDASTCNGKTFAIFSVMSDKDVRGMVAACEDRFDAWFLADQANNNRAVSAAGLAEILREEGNQMISLSKNITQAFRRAQSLMRAGDRLVIFGSFLTVAAVMPIL
ncbi:MAG: folylpolyglutamate synthase/dihydrofolate synthase family protein, partial [Halioglobus sp.]